MKRLTENAIELLVSQHDTYNQNESQNKNKNIEENV